MQCFVSQADLKQHPPGAILHKRVQITLSCHFLMILIDSDSIKFSLLQKHKRLLGKPHGFHSTTIPPFQL
jgi:hypothetical protein